MFTILIDRTLCIGAGNCCGVAPRVFELDDEMIAIVVDPQGASDQELLDAAWSCPTDAIALLTSDDQQAYP